MNDNDENNSIDFNPDLSREDIEHKTFYPAKENIIGIHDDIISEDDDADPGLFPSGDGKIDFVLSQVKGGITDEEPETVHEKALLLFKRIASNHPFVDGNKRTALNTTWTFYALNGYYFDYGEEIKAILKLFAVKEEMVDTDEALSYFADITHEANSERAPDHMAQLIHLRKWHRDLVNRIDQAAQDLELEDEFGEDNFQRMMSNMAETYHLILKLVDFREEHQEALPDEFVETIDHEEEWMNEIIDKTVDGADEESLEEISEVTEADISSVDELEAIAEQLKPKNARNLL